MHYTREQHKRFLDKELTAVSEEYLKKLNSKATALLSNNEIYVTQFVKLDLKNNPETDSARNVLGSGQLMLRFKKDKGIPRKNEYFTAVILEKDMCLPKNWGDLSWGKLRSHQVEFSEVHCVWQGKTDDKGFLLCGFSGISLEMSQYLTKNNLQGCVVVLGPQEPPMDYYQHLIEIVSNTKQMPASSILDFDKKDVAWNPDTINSDSSNAEIILKALESKDELVFQGPPGTGKTYLMASLVARLLEDGKSVLITAMTNRALIELAQKESLSKYLADGKIMKTNVSADEITECRHMLPIESKAITCLPGKATLSTFYNSSGWAGKCYEEQPFDYVIMDEASQALFGMIAACKNLGKKIIWIGDQNQMQPIVLLSEETLIRNDYYMLADGFKTLCSNFEFKSFILNETHRLLPKAAALTSLFYHIPIKSVAEFSYQFADSKLSYLPSDGGCAIINYDMPIGVKDHKASCEFTINIVENLLGINKKLNIAVLSKFRASVRMLQNYFISKFGSMDNVLIDTVERVQGMTCDVCIYYIPNAMMGMSLDRPLFNVATSRAKQLSIVICDKTIRNCNCDNAVRNYLRSATNGIVETTYPDIEEQPKEKGQTVNTEIKVVGWVDPSSFETPKQRSVKSDTKKNYYVIDTNVFVNCPDIINKIDSRYNVVLSAKVIDELDKLKIKLNNAEKRNVETALRLINRAMDNDNVSMELSNSDLLPDDFNKKSPDNNILTVALKFKDENPILLTSDNGLQVKAKGLKIKTITLKEFLKR